MSESNSIYELMARLDKVEKENAALKALVESRSDLESSLSAAQNTSDVFDVRTLRDAEGHLSARIAGISNGEPNGDVFDVKTIRDFRGNLSARIARVSN